MLDPADFEEDIQYERIEPPKPKKVGFYAIFRCVLIAGRFVGLLPISGLLQNDSQLTRFTWKSPYTLVFLVFTSFQIFKLIFFCRGTFSEPPNIEKMSPFLLALLTLIVATVLIPFCYNWKKMINKIEDIEKTLPPIKESFIKKIRILGLTMFVGGMVEHLLNMINSIYLVHTCHLLPNDSGLHYKSFIMYTLSWIYKVIPFDYFTSAIIMVARMQTTFIWNYTDVLVIVVSIYLIIRFNDFNKLLEAKEQELSFSNSLQRLPWPELQAQYTKLMNLVETLDRYINPLVFISYSNLFFIGKQMYLLLNNKLQMNKNSCYNPNIQIIMLIYYVYSTFFLILRTTLVCCLGAHIHTLSRKPLDCLATIPQAAYDNNFQRFMDQVYNSNVCLSGLRCFIVTRDTILSMLTTLLTFELVLFQNKHH